MACSRPYLGLWAKPWATSAVIADPPRAGLGRTVVQALAALRPSLLLYISCDPATLARDARELIRGGFALSSITLFDLFPQTYHLESLSVWTSRL